MAMPDVCLTPTPVGSIPIPYPNMAMLEQALISTMSESVKIGGFNAATVQTEIPMSEGDDAGVSGGVMSGTFAQGCKFKIGSESVKWEGQQAVYQGCLIGHNNTSNPNMPAGNQIVPSQETVTIGP